MCVLFLQSHTEEDAERVQLVHLNYAHHVHAVSIVWLPHLLRYEQHACTKVKDLFKSWN